METVYVKLSSKGQLVIPAAFRKKLGMETGTRIAMRVEGSHIVLDPQSLAAKLRLVEEMCGITAGGPSMTDSLLEGRRRERELELSKDGW
jgi:AbrB family looped-hinge helix DNA binding protein